MKKIFRILIIVLLVLNIQIIYVHSETLNLYENYKESPLKSQDYEELKSYIVENTITNDEEIAQNSNISDTSNSSKNNNETLNTISEIKSKNMNRVLTIIFLVLFSCVVVSLLIDSIFFNREN